MSVRKVLIGFVPWAVFSLVATRAGPGAIGVAASLAFLVALGLVVWSVRRGESVKLLEVTAVIVFAGFAGVSLITSAADDFLADYGRALAALVLALVIFVLLPVLPFTEQYARESVPRKYWHTPRFRAMNRRISAIWGVVVAGMAVSHAVAGAVAVPDPGVRLLHRPVDLVFNWVIPGLLVWLAVTDTAKVSAAASEPYRAGALRTPTRHADTTP